MQNRIIQVNPTHLQTETTLLADFLQAGANHHQYLFFANTNYPLSNEKDSDQICLTHHLLYRQCNHNPLLYRWEIFKSQDVLYKGARSILFSNAGTLFWQGPHQLGFKPARYIIKLQVHGEAEHSKKVNNFFQRMNVEAIKSTSVEHIEQEVNFSQEAGLKMKEATWLHHGKAKVSFIISERLHAKELFSLLVEDQATKQLTVNARLALTIKVLLEYKHQVSDLHIVHRDIKGENIMIDMTESPLKINYIRIIDYAFSKSFEEYNSTSCGTPNYTAPEVSLGLEDADEKADIYSFGELLKWLWHLDENEKWVDDFIDLPGRDKKAIAALLLAMKSDNKNDRPKLLEIIDTFERIQLDRKLKSMGSKRHQSIRTAYGCAREASLTLDDLVSTGFLEKEFSVRQRLRQMNNTIVTALNKIQDEPLTIQQFIDKLDIDVFRHAKSKSDIQTIMDNMPIALNQAIIRLFNLCAIHKLSVDDQLSPLFEKYRELNDKLDHKIGRMPLTIDRIQWLINKFHLAIKNNKKLLDEIHSKYPVRVSLESLHLESRSTGIFSANKPTLFPATTSLLRRNSSSHNVPAKPKSW